MLHDTIVTYGWGGPRFTAGEVHEFGLLWAEGAEVAPGIVQSEYGFCGEQE